MKLKKHNNNYETNIKTESQDFGIGNASVIIDILRNKMYKYKIRTLVQEYLCNGRDATREAGHDTPIKVFAPTHFEPTFKVRDYGVGVSPERMSSVFIMYGNSTKRDTNSQTGGFGLGAKSAWAYTDSFNIVTYIDGIKRTYLAHTGTNNNGKLEFLGEMSTNEPNGTEIIMAVNPDDVSQFHKAIKRAIHFWDEKVELVGLDLDKDELERGIKVSNQVEILPPAVDLGEYGISYYDKAVLAIDGVLYPTKMEVENVRGTAVIHIETGKVEVSASREEVAMNDSNEKYLASIFNLANNAVKHYIANQLKNNKSVSDAVKTGSNLSRDFYGNYKYDVYQIHQNTVSSDSFASVNLINYSIRRGKLYKTHIADKTRSWSRRTDSIQLNDLYYFDNSESLVKRNLRIREFLESNRVITVLELKNSDTKTYKKLIKDLGFKDLKTLSYTEKPKTGSTSLKMKRLSTEFCIHEINRSWGLNKFHTTLAKNTDVWYYIEMDGNSFGLYDKRVLKSVASYLNINICGLSKKTVAKVKSDKNFKSYDTLIKNIKPTKEQLASLKYQISENKNFLLHLDLSKINNKKVKKFHSIFKDFNGPKAPLILKDKWVKIKEVQEFLKLDTDIKSLFSTCTLLDTISMYRLKNNEDTYIYLNAKIGGKND